MTDKIIEPCPHNICGGGGKMKGQFDEGDSDCLCEVERKLGDDMDDDS